MKRIHDWLGLCIIGLAGWCSGCATHPEWALPKEPLSTLITDRQEPRVARLQSGPVTLKPPSNFGAPSAPVQPTSGVRQTSLSGSETVQVSVRAWVNNRPIFDREVMEMARPGLARAAGMLEPQRSAEMTKIVNFELNKLIDSELMWQEATRRLEKANPRALDKLREFVDQEFDKTMQRLRNAKVAEKDLREMEPIARRMLERDLISMEYARSRIVPIVQARVGFQEIRDYYEAHKNEYVTTDRIEWQDVFIPVSASLPTVDDVKRFAEEFLSKCRTREDFNALMVYNEGDSKLRGGDGLGNRRGEIQPSDLEDLLFQLPEWAPGPVVPYPRGVHVVRVTKREIARQLPLEEKLQKEIRKELERQLADREYRRIARDLRTRAVVRIERDTP